MRQTSRAACSLLLLAAAAAAAAAALAGCGSSKTKTVTVSTAPAASSSSSASASSSTTATTPPPRPTIHVTSFQSPSDNTGCVIASGIARCDIKQRTWSPPSRPRSCPTQVDFGQGLETGSTGPGRLVCAGDTALNPTAQKFDYGTSSVVGQFSCATAASGITCTNTATNHGFTIAAQSYRTS